MPHTTTAGSTSPVIPQETGALANSAADITYCGSSRFQSSMNFTVRMHLFRAMSFCLKKTGHYIKAHIMQKQ
jgi:hypothetical protein